MKFKVGDKVRVREDLVVDEKYGDLHLTKSMERFKGQIVTIEEVREEDRTRYNLKEDDNKFWWSTEMLEPIEKEKNNMNIEELNLEYKTKMDALMEEYKTKAKELAEGELFIREGQRYFVINDYFRILTTKNFDCEDDVERIQIGNCYPFIDENKEEVYKEVELIAERRKLQSEMEMFARLNNDCEIDWSNTEQYKWSLYIDYAKNEIMIYWAPNCRDLNNIYFTSEEIAQQALEKFGDRIRELYLKEEQ